MDDPSIETDMQALRAAKALLHHEVSQSFGMRFASALAVLPTSLLIVYY